MTDALLKGAILSQFLKNLAEAVLQMGFRIVTLIFMFKCELRVDYFVIMLYLVVLHQYATVPLLHPRVLHI